MAGDGTRTSEILNNEYVRYTITRSTGSAAINESITAPTSTRRWTIKEIRLHLSALGGSGDLTVTNNNDVSAVYDVNVLTQDMTSVQDLVWSSDVRLPLEPDDVIDIDWANAGGATYGLEVVTMPIY